MNNEHNPVAQLVTRIQQKWISEVSPHEHIQWVRWIIKPDHARLYEGFLRLESTPHGVIPDIPIVLLSPFEDSKSYSKALLKDWLVNFEKDEKVQEQIKSGKLKLTWNKDYFQNQLQKDDVNFDLLLIELLENFQKSLPNSRQHLVLSLLPYTVQSTEDYREWMNTILTSGLPNNVRLMVFDHSPENYFEPIQIKHKDIAKSLMVDLDLEGATKKLALSGDPNDPEVQFRECMLEMGNSAAKNNRKRLHQWGEKGIEVTQKTGNKASFATAHTVYAGMLFNFKEFDTIDKLLQRAQTIAKQAFSSGDDSVKPILLQTYGFMAASKQHQKEVEKAADLFCQQAELAISFKMAQQALTAYMTAYTLVKKKNTLRYREIVAKAYNFAQTLTPEALKTSPIGHIALEHHSLSDPKVQKQIDSFMTELEDKNWKEQLEMQEHNLKSSVSA
ncbi:hypothetical protein [Zobellia sp. B3R18]|uniref:hypothetical protein n=1 Tax=Zobellia sp. B3R18 TaxID=2841568 RepID=UPI001C079B48|nr:hypothetical protein [Zobellia sp. B3R18]MBU2976061.1 hypothetical protein [Zobellia sp. B3R18]